MMIVTGFKCDRCGELNAFHFEVAVAKQEDKIERRGIDLCSRCFNHMTGCLFARMPWEDRKNWLEGFRAGIIS